MPTAPIPPYPGVTIERQQTVWSDRFAVDAVGFRHRRFDGQDSGLRTWEMFRRGPAAALLPYDPWTDQVVLIEQFRLPALAAGFDPLMIEIPAGLCDPGEHAEATARREAQEEMNLAPDLVAPMLDVVLSAGGSDERCTLFAGRVHAPPVDRHGIAGHAGLAAEQEDIRIHVLPATSAIGRATTGHYPNSVTTLSLLWLAARRDSLRSEWLA